MALLEKYSEGKFRNGAIARILAREFWTKGIAPSFKEFAEAWLMDYNQHDKPNAEWTFLADKAEGKNTTEWKKLRIQKAKSVLKILKSLPML